MGHHISNLSLQIFKIFLKSVTHPYNPKYSRLQNENVDVWYLHNVFRFVFVYIEFFGWNFNVIAAAAATVAVVVAAAAVAVYIPISGGCCCCSGLCHLIGSISRLSISFYYSTCLSSIISISFHYSTYFSSVFSISFHFSTCISSISYHYSTCLSSIFSIIIWIIIDIWSTYSKPTLSDTEQ